MFDRVTPADPELEIIWNLHAYQKPLWNGTTEAVETSLGHRAGGHFLHTAGGAFRISNGQSDMIVTTLLPKQDGRTVRTIGGQWNDFEVDGVNYGPTEATYELLKKRRGDGGLEGVAGWRIEISPTHVTGVSHFLHVLRMGEAGGLKPAPVELLTRAARTGAKVTLDGTSYELLFDTSGSTGGHIRILDGTSPGIDEELVTRVEDRYDRWKSDSRYRDWMTNPFMRTVIFPYGRGPEQTNNE